MFNGIHNISIQLLGELSSNYQILYVISDIFLLSVIFISFVYMMLLPFKITRGWR